MSKRFRLFIVLFFLIVAGIFLTPTVRWYAFIPQEDKDLAASGRAAIQRYAQDQAASAVEDLAEIAQSDPDAAVPEEYRFMTGTAADNLKAADESVPDEWTVSNLLGGFADERAAFEVVESHHRERMQDLRDMRSQIIELGLDLSGGVSVTLQPDRASLEER
ncbi:MAG: protein translocase subunit SecD, partial [Spirochaetia bacterium]